MRVKKQRRKNRRRFLFGAAALVAVVALVVFLTGRRSIPASVIEFGQKYPEASGFVEDYPKYKDQKQDMDISGEVEQGTIPLFIQWDRRWGYERYGSDLLAITGCGPTCISMVLCGLTGDTAWNPYEVAKFSEEHGYYVPGEGTSWELMTEGAGLLGLDGAYGEVSSSYIYEKLGGGCPLICSMYPGDFTYTGHFIVLTGVDADGRILVNDPNSRINSEKHWDMEVLLPQIRSVWVYS